MKFNVWLSDQLKYLWEYKWIALIIPFAFTWIRKSVIKSLKYCWKGFNVLFNKLPFMTRIAELERQNILSSQLQQRMHEENTSLLKQIASDLAEIGRTAKRISSRQKNVENTLNIAKLEIDSELNVVDCTHEFLNLVDRDKADISGKGYMNSIYFDDRKLFEEQLQIVKTQKIENDFDIRLMHNNNSYMKAHVKVVPFICIKNEFIGGSITFTKI